MISKDILFLHLEDMPSVRDILKKHLVKMGFTVPPLEAGTVAEAQKLVEQNSFGGKKINFIISDWNLPDDTGLCFLKKVRTYEEFNQVPFIMATTENEITYMLDAINSGCTNYIVKPWDFNDLHEKIESSEGWKYTPPGHIKQIKAGAAKSNAVKSNADSSTVSSSTNISSTVSSTTVSTTNVSSTVNSSNVKGKATIIADTDVNKGKEVIKEKNIESDSTLDNKNHIKAPVKAGALAAGIRKNTISANNNLNKNLNPTDNSASQETSVSNSGDGSNVAVISTAKEETHSMDNISASMLKNNGRTGGARVMVKARPTIPPVVKKVTTPNGRTESWWTSILKILHLR